MVPLYLIAAFCLAADAPATADWLLGKNEEALGRIHSIRATIDSSGSYDGVTWKPVDSIRLVMSGGR